MNLFTAIYRFNKFYVIRLQEICSAKGITPVQWLVLQHIYKNEGCTSIDIVKEWSVEKPTVSSLVRKLYEQGLLDYREGEDKRHKRLYLTEEGYNLCGKVAEKVTELQSFVTEPMPEETMGKWTEMLHVLEGRLKQYES